MKKRSGPSPRGKIVSFRSGLDALPRALAERLGPAYRGGATVTRVRRAADGLFAVALASGETVATRRVVIALPQAIAARVVDSPEAPALAADVPAASVAVVALGFRRDRVRHPLDGFGCLVPSAEGREILGCLFPSSLFPGRAPDAGHVALSAFAGGAMRPDLAALPDQAIRERVMADVESLLGTRGEPAFCHVERWPRAIPQFERGHGAFLERVARIEAAMPGLRFAGNWLRGVSVGDCVRTGFAVARELG
jgi:oxygen-dependent protoporphyrinogen oxidase